MRPLALIIKIAVFLLLLGFAVKNSDPVTVRYLLGWSWEAPLVLVLLSAFTLGVLLGLLAMSRQLIRCRRELARQRKALEAAAGG